MPKRIRRYPNDEGDAMRKNFVVYKITNHATGMLYIGSTEHQLSKRWLQHCRETYRANQKPLYQDMLKYGIEHFSIEPLAFYATHFEMRQQEYRAILHHDTLWPHGYNAVVGRIRTEKRERTSFKTYLEQASRLER